MYKNWNFFSTNRKQKKKESIEKTQISKIVFPKRERKRIERKIEEYLE